MRLLELAHKCPKSKELKRASEYKRTLTSSLGAVLDKLEAKYGTKLYTTRHQHPSIKGMEENKNAKSKNNKTKINCDKQKENRGKINNPITEQKENIVVDDKENMNIATKSKPNPMSKPLSSRINIADERPLHINRPKPNMNMMNNENIENVMKNKRIQAPRATSKDLIRESISYESKSVTYESKKEETETTNTPNHKDNSMDIDTDNDNDKNNRNILQAINVNNMKQKRSSMNMDNYAECDLNAYNFSAPSCKNATVKFHVAMEKNDDNLSMTQRYEKLKLQQSEKMKNINAMKDQYNKICIDLDKYYSFNAKPFQDTSCTDYALFQLESIRQKLKSEQELKGDKGSNNNIARSHSVELMEQDGIDNLLNSLNDQVQHWSNDT